MEEFKFKIEIHGSLMAYSNEHAKNLVEKLCDDVKPSIKDAHDLGYITQINEEIHKIHIEHFKEEMCKKIRHTILKNISNEVYGLEKLIDDNTQPSRFKHRSYTQYRECIKKLKARLSKYRGVDLYYRKDDYGNPLFQNTCYMEFDDLTKAIQHELSKLNISIDCMGADDNKEE